MKPRTFFLLGLLAMAGCNLLPPSAPDATHYYVLTTLPPKPAMISFAGAHWRIALRPVEVAKYLRGKAMEVRVAGNEITYADEARWAETLGDGLTRVLRESLEGRGGVAHVVSAPGEEHDFDVAVRVERCEGDRTAKVARLTAVVELYPAGPGTERRAREVFTQEVPGWDGSYGQLALKLSEAADGLADHIATMIGAAEKK